MSIAEPAKIITPWADTGSKNPIPENANNTTGAAGFDKGFPDITMTPPEAGGVPPAGQDFNGIFYEVTSILRYMQAGGRPTFSATLAAEIGGYPNGAMVLGDNGIAIYTNRQDGNLSNPNSGGGGWAREDLMLIESLRRSYAESGYNVVGTFQLGFTIANVNDIGIDEATGRGYTGPIGPVAAGTNPTSTGFVDVSASLVSAKAVDVSRPADTAGSTFPKRLDFYFKSAPINLIEALPSSYVTDGSVDYSTYVQKVCEYLKHYGGGKIIVPHNMKILIGNINSYANIEWFGNDWTSELIVKPSCYGISVNEGTRGTANTDDNARNCVFNGFRIRGQVETAGFSEHFHLLNLNAVSALTVQEMSLMGAQGDHIYLGSSNVAGVERHNEDVTIDRLYVDGINKDNRNGVGVIDCDRLKITNSRFRRVTRPTMPGAIDIEPNNYAFTIVRNILIEDVDIRDCDGNAAISAYVQALVAPNFNNIKYNRIYAENVPNGPAVATIVRKDVARQDPSDNCSITNVVAKSVKYPFALDGLVDALVADCSYQNTTGGAVIGQLYKPVRDVRIERVSFNNCGTTDFGGLIIANAYGARVNDCKFVDCGAPTGGDIRFASGVSERVSLIGNMYDNPAGVNTTAVSISPGHTFNPNTNEYLNNTYQGSKLLSSFPAFVNDEASNVQNVFTAATPPNDFRRGRSTALWNSPAGTLPAGYTQGVCVTENPLSTIGINQVIVQRFTPRGNGTQLDTFYRYASADGLSWGVWRKVTAA